MFFLILHLSKTYNPSMNNHVQNEAATITPEAKPRSDFCNTTFISWRMKNTNDAPMTVPRKGTNNPIAIPLSLYTLLL